MKTLPSLTIFMPFYNDAGTVARAIEQAFKYGQKVTTQLEVIAIHGGASRDVTHQELLKQKKKFPKLKVLDHRNNQAGYGVIKHGFKAATKEWIFYTDGDLQYQVAELLQLVEVQNRTQADVVNGYKLERGDSWERWWLGEVYAVISRTCFALPVRDPDCDFRLIRSCFIKKITLSATHASILIELLKKLHTAGAKFVEVPVTHRSREYGRSNYHWWQLITEKMTGDVKLWFQLMLPPLWHF